MHTYNELIKQKVKLDKFFSMFLDKFERKMNPDVPNTPIWNLYKKKMSEYTKLNNEIKIVEYRMRNGKSI